MFNESFYFAELVDMAFFSFRYRRTLLFGCNDKIIVEKLLHDRETVIVGAHAICQVVDVLIVGRVLLIQSTVLDVDKEVIVLLARLM